MEPSILQRIIQAATNKEAPTQNREAVAYSVVQIVEVYKENLDFFKNPSVENALEILAANGFIPIFLRPGDMMIDRQGRSTPLPLDNTTRMGITATGKTAMYIGCYDVDKRLLSKQQRDELYHDVGAVLLGGKRTKGQELAYFDPDILADLIKEKSGRDFNVAELQRLGIIDDKTGMVPATWLLDALVEGKIHYNLLKYFTR